MSIEIAIAIGSTYWFMVFRTTIAVSSQAATTPADSISISTAMKTPTGQEGEKRQTSMNVSTCIAFLKQSSGHVVNLSPHLSSF
jgi:hypothetical protein